MSFRLYQKKQTNLSFRSHIQHRMPSHLFLSENMCHLKNNFVYSQNPPHLLFHFVMFTFITIIKKIVPAESSNLRPGGGGYSPMNPFCIPYSSIFGKKISSIVCLPQKHEWQSPPTFHSTIFDRLEVETIISIVGEVFCNLWHQAWLKKTWFSFQLKFDFTSKS